MGGGDDSTRCLADEECFYGFDDCQTRQNLHRLGFDAGGFPVVTVTGVQDEDALVADDLEYVTDVGLDWLLRGNVQRLSNFRVYELRVNLPRDDGEVLLVICASSAVEELLSLVAVEHVSTDVEHLHTAGAHLQERLNELLSLTQQAPRALLNAL